MKKLVLSGVGVSVVLMGIAFIVCQQRASAFSCNSFFAACTYFTDQRGNATDNVIGYDRTCRATALSGVYDRTELINRMSCFLWRSGNYRSRLGAAFIIDNMLGYQGTCGGTPGQPVCVSQGTGINWARSNWNTWVALVNNYSSGNPGYWIDFRHPTDGWALCNGGLDSAYDPIKADDVFYHVYAYGTSNCYEERTSPEEITFFWPGGSFSIGKNCANIQESSTPLRTSTPPSGSITVKCDQTNYTQVATVNFQDPDGSTQAYIDTGSGPNYWRYDSSSSPFTITLPGSPTTDPVNPQPVNLYVKDVGIFADYSYHRVAVANTDVPCVSLGCGSPTTDPQRLDPYMDFVLTASIATRIGVSLSGGTISLQATTPTGTVINKGTANVTWNNGVASAPFNFTKTNQTGVFHLTWVFNDGNESITCSGQFSVINLPYLQVFGGDVMVGSSPQFSGTASSCTPTNNRAGIFSWNNHSSNFSGAGAEFAVQTAAQIEDFASAQLPSGTSPAKLSFANASTPTPVDTANGLFGGYFNAGGPDCDFTSDLNPASALTTNTTIPPTTVSPGVIKTIYINGGDAYISGDITYGFDAPGGWSSNTKIPYFRLVVVGGDIYIGANVQQLDGLYVAEQDGSNNGGNIYTCASAPFTAADPTNLGLGYYGLCNKQLVVNGSFVANDVELLRTHGTLGQAKQNDTISSNNAAEVFNYTPELWLPRAAGASDNGYSAITGLPPVL